MSILLNILFNLVLGLLPEVIYFTLFLIYTKNIKDKKIKLFILIALAYTLCICISRFKILYYISFIALVYFILKILYKEKAQITDIFAFGICTIYLTTLSYISSCVLKGNYENYKLYYILYIIDRIFIFIPFIFKNKFNIIYKKYCLLWNRNNDVKRPIKSITLRNISLVIINISIFLWNIYLISIIN